MNPTLQRLHNLKVLIAIPSTGMWPADFGISLCGMALAFNKHAVGVYKSQELQIFHMRGSILPNLRWDAVRKAREVKADYLLFVDSDQRFPKTTLHQLLSHGKDCVAANIATKRIPAQPTARKATAQPEGEPVYTDPESTGLEKVWRIGCGVMLLSKKAYWPLGPDAFAMPYVARFDKYQGEDWTLCSALDDLGVEIFIDHDLSKYIGHIGSYVYDHSVIGRKVCVKEGEDVLHSNAL